MFCNKCGTKAIENTSFCSNCGNSLNNNFSSRDTTNLATGKNYLKVSSIILLIIMGLGVFVMIVAPYLLYDLPETPALYDVFSAIHVIFMIYCCVVGIKYCVNLEKAKHLYTIGQIALCLGIVDIFFYAMFSGYDALYNVMFVIPFIFYLIGASKNKENSKMNCGT
jgi:hypothetical protein